MVKNDDKDIWVILWCVGGGGGIIISSCLFKDKHKHKHKQKDEVKTIWVILWCVAGGGGIIISSCLVRAALHAHSVTREYTEYTSKLYIT